MDEEGVITIKIHDLAEVSKAVWLEEMAHALQYLRDGNVPLSIDQMERGLRESEVASCLLNRHGNSQLSLTNEDALHYKNVLTYYEVSDGNN